METTHIPVDPDIYQEPPQKPQPVPKHNLLLISAAVLGLVFVAVASYFVSAFQSYKKFDTQSNLYPPKVVPTEVVKQDQSPTQAQQQTTNITYTLRQFDPNEPFFDGYLDGTVQKHAYPSSIRDIPDTGLTPISCSHFYSGWGGKFNFNDETTNTQVPLTDPVILGYIDEIQKQYNGQQVTEIQTCQSEKEKTIVIYALGPCGGGCSGIPYVGVAKNGSVEEIAKIGTKSAYFGCRKPLMLTTTDNFYLHCGGGDGGYAGSFLYKISLTGKVATKLYECQTIFNEQTNKGEVICQ